MAKEALHPIIEGISNYLEMKTTGALMITGHWGCGKTYFIKNEVIPYTQKVLGKNLIMVSLFGINDLSEIPERVLYAYWDAYGKDKTGFNLGRVADVIAKMADSIPKLKEYVDIDKILGRGQGIYKLIPNDVIICLDDLERVVDSIDINNVLGVINELVENLEYKVIVIANEGFIKNNELIFKEKVVEKTLVFIPNIINIYQGIVLSYNDEQFTSYMLEIAVKLIDSKNALYIKSESYRKHVSNIRILKFAIEHFYCVFSYYEKHTDITSKNIISKLNNYWTFILAISIEYKLNNISYEDDKTLSKYVHNALAKFDFDENNEKISFEDEIEDTASKEEQKLKVNADSSFQETFYKRYFITQGELPIFHSELYAFITGAITPNFEKLDSEMDKALKQLIPSNNPAHELLSLFMNGIWGFSNDEVGAKLDNLFDYVNKGELNDYISYLNASFYLLNYKNLYSKTDEEIMKGIKTGIGLFTDRIEITYFVKSNLHMVESHLSESVRVVYDYINTLIPQKEEDQDKKEQELVEQNFIENIKLVVEDCMCIPYGTTPKYVNYPILKYIRKKTIIDKINNAEPIDIYWLFTLLQERYEKGLPEIAQEEIPFLLNLKEAISQLELNNSKLSNTLIKSHLLPKIESILGRLASHLEAPM